ncbi:MAG: hypothetical protein ACI8W8_000935 [Rhodothermales bacterium]|jgi:hypothetical protein
MRECSGIKVNVSAAVAARGEFHLFGAQDVDEAIAAAGGLADHPLPPTGDTEADQSLRAVLAAGWQLAEPSPPSGFVTIRRKREDGFYERCRQIDLYNHPQDGKFPLQNDDLLIAGLNVKE